MPGDLRFDGKRGEQGSALLTGSLMLEASALSVGEKAIGLVDCCAGPDRDVRLAIDMDRRGVVSVGLGRGAAARRISVTGLAPSHDLYIRLTYSWDVPARLGLLTVEDLDNGTLHQAEFDDPQPLSGALIERIGHKLRGGQVDPSVVFLGVSDQVEPVGLVAGIAENSPVETPDGMRMIEHLRPGDLVLTEDAGPQPVASICMREVPVLGRFRPLRLRAPYFGLTRDILVLSEQQLMLGGAEVEYLFGEESVLVEARHLGHRVAVAQDDAPATIRYYHLLMQRHEVIRIAGCRLESLFIGSIADHPQIVPATILRHIPADALPRHEGLVRPQLQAYEALTLQSAAYA